MRILLLQNMFFHRTHGGAAKSNRIMLEQLAARGHDCRVVAPITGELGRTGRDELLDDLTRRGAQPQEVSPGLIVASVGGVLAHFVVDPPSLARQARRVAEEFQPDWTLVPSDDPALMMLAVAHRASPGRVVYLAHTLQQFPFGPRAFYPSRTGASLVRRCAAAVSVSEAARRYLKEWGGVDSVVIHPHVYGDGPHRVSGGELVTMINPCGYKGISLLLSLADTLPDVRFLAVPTWGTTDADREALERRRNIEIGTATDDIGSIWARTKVALMPSLWDETFGYTAVEAMLHGVPVLASEIGGLTEAKLGVPYLLPVRPIDRYATIGGRPEPEIPAQDQGPWAAALKALLNDDAHHTNLAARGREAAARFVASLDPGQLEELLLRLPNPLHPEERS